MKIITDLQDLKKGDSVIIKNSEGFEKRGLLKISGDVFNIQSPELTIKCVETNEIEKVNFFNSKVYLITAY